MQILSELERLRERFGELGQEVARRLTPKRWAHTQRVAETAVQLAMHWGADTAKAYLAGLLHDVAKDLSRKSLLNTALDFGIVLTAFETATPALIHAPVGAEVARREFGIEDPEIIAAIRYHTTARANMSLLEKLIFLADYIEPERSFPGVDTVRVLARQDVDKAMLLALTQSIEYLLQRDRPIAVEAVEARNYILMNSG